MKASDVTETLELALEASGCYQATVVHRPRLLSDNGSSYVASDLAAWLSERNMTHIRGAPQRYLNSYGSVPTRDDVRFDLAIKEVPIPPDGRPPAASDYPTKKETAVPEPTPVSGRSGSIGLVKNASYLGHARWTDPTPATGPRDYRVKLPAACGRRHLVRVLPKRFCFDQSNIAYSTEDYLRYADVTCD